MGTIFRKAWTAPLPNGAEIVESGGTRMARWRLRNGKLREAEVFDGRRGDLRIRGKTRCYIAKYRDENGVWVEYPTDCRDEVAARAILGQLERRAELIRAGVISAEEAETSRHSGKEITVHVDSWIQHQRTRGVSERWRKQARQRVLRVCAERQIRWLRDLKVERVERWLREQADAGMSAGTRNGYVRSLLAFCRWCVRTNRLPKNPLENVAKANEAANQTRTRRAFTVEELHLLFDAARRRPLEEAMRIRRGPRKGELGAKVKPETRQELERLGRERELIYRTLVMTGLRKNELASITIRNTFLDAPVPHLALDARDEKNRKGSEILIRKDLAAELRAWLDESLGVLQDEARRVGGPIPAQLLPDMKLLNVPSGLIRIFDKDLLFAGLARMEVRDGKQVLVKTDDRGHTLDVHSLRKTFATMLSQAGVPLRTAQAAMRHSNPALTAGAYTDPRLLDVAGAVEALPLT